MKGKKIVWGNPICNDCYQIMSIHIPSYGGDDIITIVIQKGNEINHTRMTIEHAQQIGFIDLSKLQPYIKQ